MTELRALTSVRGIAAWMVVLYHIRLSIAGLPQGVVDVLAKGYLAVDFFFLLSGCVIWMTWGDRLRAGGLAAVPGFLQKRIARIWPLHFVVLAGAVALALLMATTGRHDGREFPFGELPLHLLLIQNWGFTPALTWNDPAWSISAELGAYLLFPLLAVAIDWRRVPSWAVLVAIGAAGVLLASVFAYADAPTLGTDIPRLGLVRCVIEFAMGTAVGALWLRWRDRPVGLAAMSVAVALALLLSPLPEALRIPGAFAALLLALALTSGLRGNPLEGRALHYLGEISYATYLGHFLLWFAFKLAFVADAHAVPAELVALYLMLVLSSSVALYHLVERPAQKWVNDLKLPSRLREGPGEGLSTRAGDALEDAGPPLTPPASGRGTYFPVKTPGRFSTNAAMPSLWSCVPNSPWNSRRSNSTPWVSPVSNAALTISLFASTASGAIAAIVAAVFTASSTRSAAGTMRDTSPARSASSAPIIRPVRHISIALALPTARVRRCDPPMPGLTASLISGWPNLAVSAARMKSHIIASSHPPPSA
jgi:peptidoglycan/LPS O-acetylase OafA/YrhL